MLDGLGLPIRPSFLVTLAAWATFLTWNHLTLSAPSSTPTFASSPSAPTLQLAEPLSPETFDGHAYVRDAIARIRAREWLVVDVRQRTADRMAEGVWRHGPDGCARLDLAWAGSKLSVISDGRVLARVLRVGDAKPNVAGVPLPKETRERLLAEQGCGGPAALLESLAVRTWRSERLTESDGERIVLSGSLDSGETVHVTFDATTRWPLRIDWRTPRGLACTQEFLAPRSEPLTTEACVRHFSY